MSREYVKKRLAEIRASQHPAMQRRPPRPAPVKLANIDQNVEFEHGQKLRSVTELDWMNSRAQELRDHESYQRALQGPLPNILPPRLHADDWVPPEFHVLSLEKIRRFRRIDLGALRPGVYFLFTGSQLQYIGSSINVRIRVTAHLHGKRFPFDRATYLPVPSPWHLSVEAMYIQYYRPDQNSTFCERQDDER